jgi:hypothetical protein
MCCLGIVGYFFRLWRRERKNPKKGIVVAKSPRVGIPNLVSPKLAYIFRGIDCVDIDIMSFLFH